MSLHIRIYRKLYEYKWGTRPFRAPLFSFLVFINILLRTLFSKTKSLFNRIVIGGVIEITSTKMKTLKLTLIERSFIIGL